MISKFQLRLVALKPLPLLLEKKFGSPRYEPFDIRLGRWTGREKVMRT